MRWSEDRRHHRRRRRLHRRAFRRARERGWRVALPLTGEHVLVIRATDVQRGCGAEVRRRGRSFRASSEEGGERRVP